MTDMFGPELLVGRHAGVIGGVDDDLYSAGEAALARVFAEPGHPTPVHGCEQKGVVGVGSGFRRDGARLAAIMEAFERECLLGAHVPRRTATLHSLRASGTAHLAPAELACFLDHQFDDPSCRLSRTPDDHDEIDWLSGFSLVSGADLAIPAHYCIFDCAPLSDKQHWYTPNSNGAGAGTTPFAACLSGLLELLERDAFMLMWHHKLSMPHLTIDPHSMLGHRVSRYLTRRGVEYRLVDLSEVHQVPVVVAITWSELRDRRAYTVGAAAAASRLSAAEKALTEAAGGNCCARDWIDGDEVPSLKPPDVVDFDDHVKYYLDPTHHAALDLLLAERPATTIGPESEPELSGEPQSVLRRLTHRLQSAAGVESYAVDLTPPGAAQFGLFVYKVVSPHLLPLDFGHSIRHMGHPRVRTDPGGKPIKHDELNPEPHPFP